MLKAVGCDSAVAEKWSPYSRTSFVKVRLTFPNPEAHISVRRQFQTSIVDKLKSKSFTSGVAGSVGSRLWATKSKTPEERAKIRAIVLCKEFIHSRLLGMVRFILRTTSCLDQSLETANPVPMMFASKTPKGAI